MSSKGLLVVTVVVPSLTQHLWSRVTVITVVFHKVMVRGLRISRVPDEGAEMIKDEILVTDDIDRINVRRFYYGGASDAE